MSQVLIGTTIPLGWLFKLACYMVVFFVINVGADLIIWRTAQNACNRVAVPTSYAALQPQPSQRRIP